MSEFCLLIELRQEGSANSLQSRPIYPNRWIWFGLVFMLELSACIQTPVLTKMSDSGYLGFGIIRIQTANMLDPFDFSAIKKQLHNKKMFFVFVVERVEESCIIRTK